MNIPVVLIVPALAALGMGGAWYYRTSETETARRDAAMSAAQERAEGLKRERDTARGEAASRAAERDEARAQLSAAQAGLAERAKERDGARSEAARIAAERDAAGAREAAQKARADALAEAVHRSVRIRAMVNEEVHGAARAVSTAQDTLYRAPTPEAFVKFRDSLLAADTAIKAAQTAIEEFTQFAAEQGTVLADHAADIDATRQPFARTAAFLDTWSSRVTQTLGSCRAQALTVRSDKEWQPSDLWVETGECVAFYSTGEWQWDGSVDRAVGAQGEDGGPNHRIAGEYANGALLGRVRGSDHVHHAVAPIKAESLGRFEFRINDAAYTDNRGSLEVFVWAWKPVELE